MWVSATKEKKAAQEHQSLVKSLILERKDLGLKEAQPPYCDLIPETRFLRVEEWFPQDAA